MVLFDTVNIFEIHIPVSMRAYLIVTRLYHILTTNFMWRYGYRVIADIDCDKITRCSDLLGQ